MGQPHQLLSLDEGPSKGAATQSRPRSSCSQAWLWQKGSKREVTRCRARAPIHSISSLELLPQELFERSGRSGHFIYLRTSEYPCQRDQADEKCLGKLLVADRCQWELKKSFSLVNRERPSHYLPFPHSKVFRVILFFFFFFGSFYFPGHPDRQEDLNGDFVEPCLLGMCYLEIIESEVKEIWGNGVKKPQE